MCCKLKSLESLINWLQATVNIDNFTQYIFLHIPHGASGAQKYDVSENYNHNRTNRINWYICAKI